MTQEDLARAVGMPQPSIARIERGAVVPRTATVIQLLAATGHRLTVEPIGPAVDRQAIKRRLAMSDDRRARQAMGSAARDSATNPYRLILRQLRRSAVPFVLIGELAEVVHGSPIKLGPMTEVCHATTKVGMERLAKALEELGPKADAGRLRLVTSTEAGDDYEVLERNAVGMLFLPGLLVRVAAPDDLIRARLARGTPEDLEAAAVLRAIEE